MNYPAPTPVLDREIALARVGGDLQLLREVATLFLENYDPWIAELREAATRGDAQALERTAHGIKGSVATFGARAAVEAAQQIEQCGRRHDFSEVLQAVSLLELALATLRPELESL